MKPKKTISERLTNKYLMVIRNEENLAETSNIGFTYAKVLVISVSLFVLLFAFSLFLSKTLLAKWFDPKHAQMEANKKLYELALKVDSLAIEVHQKDMFIQNFQRVLSGDTASGFTDPAEAFTSENRPVSAVGNMKLAPSDSLFRQEFEKSEFSLVTLASGKYRELQEMFFFTPITGFVSDHYDIKKGHFGVDIVAKTNEPVKCVADGVVVLASWTQDSGHVIAVQHRGNLVSVYKHNAGLLKKVGSFVNAGDIISIVGNSGEMTDGPHLHFEMWYNGNSINPEDFVTF
ncbi:MAG TPA: M23 family metallopeptidase [Cyclobacteriaceae bacterium]|nr:M23 family metallopeptidase [Cyclobacteriaceae bacterium]